MFNRINWCRSGNFYQTLTYQYNAPKFLTNIVKFKNIAESKVIIREIEVMLYSNGDSKIALQASPFSYQKLFNTCKKHFGMNEMSEWLGLDAVSIVFNSTNLEKIITILNGFNLSNEYPKILFQELTQLAASITFPLPESFHANKHLIGERTVSESHVNPFRKNSFELIKLLQKISFNYSREELELNLKKLLVQGEDPNQENIFGETPLHKAIMSKNFNPSAILLLLCYGANPWQARENGLSAIEMARKFLKHEEYNFIMNACDQAEKRMYSSNSTKLNSSLSLPKANSIVNHFELSNSLFISTEFKNIQHLNFDEKVQLLNLYKHCYSTKGNINDAFKKAFSPEHGKVIDILRNKDYHIIGAVISVIRKSENDIHVFIMDSILHSEYQGCGIMPLIDYRLPFALQSLYHEYNVSIHFFAASYNAIRRVEKALFFPKYQPDGMKDKVKNVYTNVFNYPIDWHHGNDKVFFHVTEENHINVNVKRKPVTTILEEFYYQYLKSNSEGYIPVLILPEEDLLSKLQDILSPRNINFYDQYQQFAKMIKSSNILSHCLPVPCESNKSFVMDSNHLFWTGKRIQIDDKSMVKYSVPETKSISISKY